jgi:hypothetical protein
MEPSEVIQLPEKSLSSLPLSYIEEFHSTVLRSREQQAGFRDVERNLVHGSRVVLREDVLLLRSGRSGKIPNDNGPIRGSCRQVVF